MNTSERGYSKTFNHLCHFVALTRDGRPESVIENLVATALVISDGAPVRTAKDLSELINTVFGLDFTTNDVDAALNRLLPMGIVVRSQDGALRPSAETEAKTKERVRDANALEDLVRETWLAQVATSGQAIHPADKEKLWKSLKLYLAKVFKRHGAQTIMLLKPSAEVNPEFDKSLSAFIKEVIEAQELVATEKDFREYVRLFFKAPDAARSRYVSQLLDGTFSFFAVCVDDATSALLTKTLPPLNVYLDTNFVFGLLKLHDNPMNDVSAELIAALAERNIPFKIYYHEATLKEYRKAFDRLKTNLERFKFTPALSRAAVQVGRLNYLERRFHEQNAKQAINVDAFLAKYRNVEILLGEKGFTIYRENKTSDSQRKSADNTRYEMIADYLDFLERRWSINRDDFYEIADHDMTLLQSARAQRKSGASVLDVGVVILTADTKLHAYEWTRGRADRNTAGQVLLPNQFLQILRPYLSVTADFDRRFAETFSVAEFRTAGTGYEVAASKVIGYLSTFSDVSEETAVRILANEVFITRVAGLDPESAEFKEAVKSELLSDNAKLIDENKKLLEEAKRANQEAINAASQAQAVLDEARKTEAALASTSRSAQQLAEKRRTELLALEREKQVKEELRQKADQRSAVLEARLAELEREALAARSNERNAAAKLAQMELLSSRRRLRNRRILATAVFIILSSIYIYLLAAFAPLSSHPKRLSLTICFLLAFLSVAVATLYPKDRLTIGTGIVAIVIAIAQLL